MCPKRCSASNSYKPVETTHILDVGFAKTTSEGTHAAGHGRPDGFVQNMVGRKVKYLEETNTARWSHLPIDEYVHVNDVCLYRPRFSRGWLLASAALKLEYISGEPTSCYG